VNKSAKIGIIVGVVIGFLLLLYFFGGKMRQQEYVTDSWEETYSPSDKGPYGTYMLKELLDTTGLFGNFLQINNKLENELEDAEGVNDIYFFVGRENYLTEEDQEFLFDFISNGNTAYMMCEFFPYGFMEEFTVDPDSAYDQELVYDSLQTFRFNHPELASTNYKAKFIYNNLGSEKYWTYFDTAAFYLRRRGYAHCIRNKQSVETKFFKNELWERNDLFAQHTVSLYEHFFDEERRI
jgi:hypothetical protein